MRYSANGKAIAKFALAVNYGYGEKKTTEFVNIVLFGEQAERVSQYITKGKSIYVQGRLQTRTWDDDQGVKHYMTEIIGNQVELLSKNEGGERKPTEEEWDDLPFD